MRSERIEADVVVLNAMLGCGCRRPRALLREGRRAALEVDVCSYGSLLEASEGWLEAWELLEERGGWLSGL